MVQSINNLLKKCSDLYYKGLCSPLTDAEFDALASKYGFSQLGTNTTEDIPHYYRMYSLNKFYKNEDDLPFIEGTIESPKLDGAAISLLYVNGELQLALTRGDGIKGEDITSNILASFIVPHGIPVESTVQICGEIVAPKHIPNARNYASGALRLKSLDEFLSREISFVAYSIHGYNNKTYIEDMELLSKWNFRTVIDSNLTNFFPTDGTVIRLNSNEEYNKLGHTALYPRGAYAVKDRADVPIVETKLLNVIWQVGKGGKITPVAIFDEIIIQEARINRATLHNVGFIEEMGLEIGDSILVTRSGSIIPKIIGKLN